jgi:hypothetical protein
MKKFILLFEERSIRDLSPGRERPMVEGIAEILRGVRDLENRRELVQAQLLNLRREDIDLDPAEFWQLCGLQAPINKKT